MAPKDARAEKSGVPNAVQSWPAYLGQKERPVCSGASDAIVVPPGLEASLFSVMTTRWFALWARSISVNFSCLARSLWGRSSFRSLITFHSGSECVHRSVKTRLVLPRRRPLNAPDWCVFFSDPAAFFFFNVIRTRLYLSSVWNWTSQ